MERDDAEFSGMGQDEARRHVTREEFTIDPTARPAWLPDFIEVNMPDNHSNLVLIGMPGAGKSTIGVLLAKRLQRNFLDTDLLIQVAEGRSLQDIVDTQGDQALRDLEAETILGLNPTNHVIATGGSAVYSDPAMQHLRRHGRILFLRVDLETLAQRLRNFETRGIARKPGQSLRELFEERNALYEQYADLTCECSHLAPEQICDAILATLSCSLA